MALQQPLRLPPEPDPPAVHDFIFFLFLIISSLTHGSRQQSQGVQSGVRSREFWVDDDARTRGSGVRGSQVRQAVFLLEQSPSIRRGILVLTPPPPALHLQRRPLPLAFQDAADHSFPDDAGPGWRGGAQATPRRLAALSLPGSSASHSIATTPSLTDRQTETQKQNEDTLIHMDTFHLRSTPCCLDDPETYTHTHHTKTCVKS